MNAKPMDATPRGRGLLCAVVLACVLPTAGVAESPSAVDVEKALARAKSEKKMVLLHFTGVDWCSECQDLQGEGLKTNEFKSYAATNFVMVEIAVRANEESPLVETYGVSGWPALVLLDAQGRPIDKVVGYRKGDGPNAVIQEIERRRTGQ